MVHEFAQEYRFKGRWDTTGKCVKHALKHEMKFYHYHDAKAYCYKMKRVTTRGRNEKVQIKRIDWEQTKYKRIVKENILKQIVSL